MPIKYLVKSDTRHISALPFLSPVNGLMRRFGALFPLLAICLDCPGAQSSITWPAYKNDGWRWRAAPLQQSRLRGKWRFFKSKIILWVFFIYIKKQWSAILGPSSCQGQGSGFGGRSSHASDSTLPHFWLSGGSRFIPSAAKCVPSRVGIFWFMLANCTSSAVSKLEHRLCWEYISRVAECFEALVPQERHYFPAEIRAFLSIWIHVTRKPLRHSPPLPINLGLVHWSIFAFHWIRGHVCPVFSFPLMFRDN